MFEVCTTGHSTLVIEPDYKGPIGFNIPCPVECLRSWPQMLEAIGNKIKINGTEYDVAGFLAVDYWDEKIYPGETICVMVNNNLSNEACTASNPSPATNDPRG